MKAPKLNLRITLTNPDAIQNAQHELQATNQNPLTVNLSAPVLLSPCEGIFWRMEESLPGSHRITAVFRLEGYVESRNFRAALDHLQRRHQKLRAEIVRGQDGRLRYHFDRAAPPIKHKLMDYEGQECDWRQEARRLLQIPVPATGPFIAFSVFRNRALNRSVLIVSTHHAIADGVSAMMLVDDLLTEYARLETHSSEPARPALELVSVARAAETAGWRDRGRLARRFMRLRIEERRARQTLLPESKHLHPIPQWEHWVFSPEETSAVLRNCREEEASLAGALVSAAYCGLMKCLPASEGVFRSQIPFSVRRSSEGPAGKISAYDLGCFVSHMNEFHRVKKQHDYWALARSASESIIEFVHNGGPALGYNLTSLSEKQMITQAYKMMPAAEKRPTILVTNYGKVRMGEGETYGSLRALEGITTLNNFVNGPSLAMAALTMGGRLNIGFAAGNLEPAFWLRLRDEVRGYLDATIQPRSRS